MASSAPSTPRRRVSSRDIHDVNDEPLGLVGSIPYGQSRLNSNEIPRSYSGLYGAGAPPMPADVINDDRGANNNLDARDDTAGGCDAGGGGILSPPRVKSSVRHHGTTHQSNLLPFELSRNRNTDWIAAGGPALLVTYVSVILVFLLTFLAFVTEPRVAWAMANVSHGLVSMVYLHWIKGNPADYMDGTQGEMNAMTTWEQIVSKPAVHLHGTNINNNATMMTLSPNRYYRRSGGARSTVTSAIRKLRSRDVLCVVPTLLAHASCHVAGYQFEYVLINVGVWAVVMLPKMPFMNGVRILGINRTAGIDDDGDYQEEDEDDECVDDTDGDDTSREDCGNSNDDVDDMDEPRDEPKKYR